MLQELIATYCYGVRTIKIVAYYNSESDFNNRVVHHYHVWEGLHCLSAMNAKTPPINEIPSWDEVYSDYYLAIPEIKD
jgi:hypothetical protein